MKPDGARALGETVKDLLVSDNTLFFTASDIGGEGTLPVEAGTQFYGVGSYNGTTWSSLATGITASGSCGTYNGRPSTHSLTGSASDLYVGGEFTSINGVSASLVARRSGGTWSALGSGLCYGDTGGDYHDINVFLDGSNLYAFGTFRKANGSTTWVNGIAKWDGTTWSALGGGMSASTYPKYGEAMAKDTVNNVLYVGGNFDAVNASITGDGDPSGAVADTAGIACWNGTTWSSIGAGLGTTDHVNAMTYDSGVLYVGGDFTTIGGVASQFVAKFTPSGPCAGTWSAVGVGGLASSVIGTGTTELCKTEDDSRRGVWSTFFTSGALYVGCFPDNDLYPQALKWNGSAWSHFDSTCTGTCTNKIGRSIGHPRDIVEFGGSLWAAGTWYVSEGGSTGLAKWATSLDPLRPTFTSDTTATNGSTFTFTVTFDVEVSGVANDDFSNSGSLTGCSFGVTATSSTTVYTLTVSSCAAGDGTVIPIFATNGATRISDSVTGPNSAVTSTATITRDTINPTIASFSSTTGNGSYKADSTINITATAGEPIRSGDTITVTLDTGATVLLTAASAGTSLTGVYTVAAGQTSSDLTVSSYTIGTVADTAGNAMTSTSVPSGASNIAGVSAIVVDTNAPTAMLGVPDLETASDTGVSTTDNITSDDTPTFSVVVTNLETGGTGYVKASKTGSSDVTCTLSAGTCTLGALAQGTWSLVSYQNDAAGNNGSTSSVSTALSITVFTAAPTTATLAASAATSSSATISFTVTGSHQLDCTSLSTTAGTDFALTAGISAITSITQTSTTVCTVNATATAGAGETVTSTLTAAASFSVADPAGNAVTTLTGSPKSITVSVPQDNQSGLAVTTTSATYGSSLTLATSGGSTGGSVSWTVSNGTATGCAISGNVLSSRSSGTCVVVATMAGSLTFRGVTSSLTPVMFAPATLTVTADAKSKTYGESDPALTYSVTRGSLFNGDRLSGALSRAAGSDAGTYQITQGSLSNPNYIITFVAATLTITAAPTTVPSVVTTTTVPSVVTTTTVPTRPRLEIPGVVAPRTVKILTAKLETDPMKIVADLMGGLERTADARTGAKVRDAVVTAAPSIGAAIAEAVASLAAVLEDKTSTPFEVTKAKAAVADAASQTIVVALRATGGNDSSIALPFTRGNALPEVAPGKSMVLSPQGVENAKLRIVDDTTMVLAVPSEKLSLAMTALEATGQPSELTSDNAVNVSQGQSLAVTGAGFSPRTEVKVWMFSSPRSFGTVMTDSNGSFAAEIPLPDNIAPGDHTAQVNGRNRDGGLRSMNLGLEVALEDATAVEPETTVRPTTKRSEQPKTLKPSITSKPATPSGGTRSARVNFRADDSRLDWRTLSQLQELLPKLRKSDEVRLSGYAHRGTGINTALAYALSMRRVKNVEQWLLERGVKVTMTKAFGSSKVLSKNQPSQNRVVEIVWSG